MHRFQLEHLGRLCRLRHHLLFVPHLLLPALFLSGGGGGSTAGLCDLVPEDQVIFLASCKRREPVSRAEVIAFLGEQQRWVLYFTAFISAQCFSVLVSNFGGFSQQALIILNRYRTFASSLPLP